MVAAETEIATQVTPESRVRLTNWFDRAMSTIAYIALIGVALLMFFPFIFSISTSLKTQAEANQQLTWKSLVWPENPTLDAYRTVFDSDIERWFANSVIVAVIWVVARAFTASLGNVSGALAG